MKITTKFAELKRVGVIDVGSNSVRMVVFDGAARSPAYFFNEKVLCGLGRDISETGVLHVEGRARALRAMERFAALARSYGVTSLQAVATAAVRDAADGPAFCEEVKQKTGIEIQVIAGRTEAKLSAQGVFLGWPTASGVVCDIGGSSLEFAVVENGQVIATETTTMGVFRLLEQGDNPSWAKENLRQISEKLNVKHKPLFLVGGAFRAFTKVDIALSQHPLSVIQGYELNPTEIRDTVTAIEGLGEDGIVDLLGRSNSRLKQIVPVSRLLSDMVEIFEPPRVTASAYGLREGVVYDQLDDETRGLDPLILAVKRMEGVEARFPNMGQQMARFLRPLAQDMSYPIQRLTVAACHLYDVAWQSHPEFRAQTCFDQAARANFGGLSHPERAFLSIALMHRYKVKEVKHLVKSLSMLVEEEHFILAKAVGLALRVGGLFGAKDLEKYVSFDVQPETITLNIHNSRRELMGEIVEKRFAKLADVLNLKAQISFHE